MKPLVIYHKGCMDGVAAAWCFWKLYGDEFDYHPGVYSEAPPDTSERVVYFVDFSYKSNVVREILNKAIKVILIDHHKSALEDLEQLKNHPKFDMSHSHMNYSGAMLSWEYNFPGKEPPAVIEYIQDRDLWRFNLAHTREVTSALFSYGQLTIQSFDALINLPVEVLKEEGTVLERKHKNECMRLLRSTNREMNIGGYTVTVCNVPSQFSSDIGNMLAEDSFSFGATYYDTYKGRHFSLRSVGDFDVSEVALKYGGGGHKNAAGFTVDREHILAKS